MLGNIGNLVLGNLESSVSETTQRNNINKSGEWKERGACVKNKK